MLALVGIKESRTSANFMVGLKLVVLAVVVGIGVFYIDTDNWTPFLPNGFTGVLKGVSAVFFAYIGFDAISTTAEECANPQRDLPRGMIYSLILCTVIYVVVTLVITGMVNYSEFDTVADPLAYVFEKINLQKVGFFVSVSAVVAATSVLLVFQIGQPRIWMSMSRDGLMPKRFGKIHPKFHTPVFATVVTGIIVAIPSLFIESAIDDRPYQYRNVVCFCHCMWRSAPASCRKKNQRKKDLIFLTSMVSGLYPFCSLYSSTDSEDVLSDQSRISRMNRIRKFCFSFL